MRGELLLVLVLTGELVLCNPQACTRYKGIKGETITLPSKANQKLSEIIWEKEVNNVSRKVAEWDGHLHVYSLWQNRAEIDSSSGNLTIRNISQDIDGGKYTAVLSGNQYTFVCLEVLEPPAAPNLTCTIGDDGIHVNCMLVAQFELPVSFHWDYIDMKDISKGNNTKEYSSVKLPCNTDLSRNITCIIEASRSMVKNSISLLTCDSRGASSQERARSITAVLIVGTIIGLIVVFFLWKKKVCRHPVKNPENEIGQISNIEENPPNDGSMSDHGQMSEPENKKTSCSEDLSNKPPEEITPLFETNSEDKETSNTEDLSNKPPEEITPLCEANSEDKETSNTKEITYPQS